MKQPNAACAGFCTWMLNISKQHLSGPQKVIVQDVLLAAQTNTPVTNQEWYNFNLFTAWRNPFYQVFNDYASDIPFDLNNGVVYAYDFEGNSFDSAGSANGTDTNVIYGPSYGKINEGVNFDGLTSYITVPSFTIPNDFTISFWIDPAIQVTPENTLIGNGLGGDGIYILKTDLLVFTQFNGVQRFSAPQSAGVWVNVTVTFTGGSSQLWMNAVTVGSPAAYTSVTGIQAIGGSLTGLLYQGNMDCLTMWNRALSNDEIIYLYNLGLGRQYPF